MHQLSKHLSELTNFSTLVDNENIYNLKINKRIHFLKQNNYSFRQCVNWP